MRQCEICLKLHLGDFLSFSLPLLSIIDGCEYPDDPISSNLTKPITGLDLYATIDVYSEHSMSFSEKK